MLIRVHTFLRYSVLVPRAMQYSAAAAARASDTNPINQNIVLIDAVRTPFLMSNSVFRDLMSVDLQRHALRALLDRTPIPYEDLGHIICGTVVQECRTSNIAREAALLAGIPNTVPCNTVTLACISSNLSAYNLTNMLRTGAFEAGIAGGVELLSDYPIRYNRKVRSAMIDFDKAKTTQKKLTAVKTIISYMFSPDLPSVTEYTTGEKMGTSGDRLAAAFGVSRKEQDEFALRSHTLAAKAAKEGKLTDIAPIHVAPRSGPAGFVKEDNGVRPSSMEQLSKLRPAFVKPHGTVTAGNASFLTDGASAALFTTEGYAKRNGLKPKAFLRETLFVSQDPKDQLLLSPAYVIPKILDKAKLSLKDIDVFEIHEAFAGQVLANLQALDSTSFAQTWMKRKEKVGEVPLEKINNWGGSLSIGHPFGATGIRLMAHAANRLIDEKGRYAIVAACAAGGSGVGMLLETCPQ